MKVKILFLSIMLFAGSRALADQCPIHEVKNNGDDISIPGYHIKLMGGDDSKNPTAWNEGISITASDGHTCTLPDGIITAPFFLAGSHLLYIDTYSGSESTQVLINLSNCSDPWSSPSYLGSSKLENNNTFFYQVEMKKYGDKHNRSMRIKIGDDCMPQKPKFTDQ